MSLALEREVEALDFAIRNGLPADLDAFQTVRTALLDAAPWSRVALNVRAREALPEDFDLPLVRTAAAAFIAGDLQAAKAASQSRAAALVAGDLALLAGAPDEAESHYRRMLGEYGPLPPVLARLSRAALEQGDAQVAERYVVAALAQNPLYGSARVLRVLVARARGQAIVDVPLPMPRVQPGRTMRLPEDTPPAEVATWQAWARASLMPDPDGLERPALDVLSEARAPEGDAILSQTVRCIQRWSPEERTVYAWCVGLQPANADAFRAFRLEHNNALLHFWTQGVVLG